MQKKTFKIMNNGLNFGRVHFPIKEYPYDKNTDYVSRKHPPSPKEVADIVRKYASFSAPRDFQRPVSWNSKEKKLFFISLLMDRVEGNFVIVDIKSALSNLKQVYPNDQAIGLFGRLLEQEQKIKYIVMDGNNRLHFLTDLLDNRYIIPTGKYDYIPCGATNATNATTKWTVRRGKQHFKDLPDTMQEAIYSRVICVSEYYQVDYYGMIQVFKNCNAGCPPNPQEFRNSGEGPWPTFVQQLSDQLSKNMLPDLFKDHTARLCGDDWIVDCLDFAIQATQEIEKDDDDFEVEFSAVNQTSKNRLYDSEFLSYQDQKFFLEKFEELTNFFTMIQSERKLHGFTDNELKRRTTWQNLFWMLCNGILTYEQVIEALKLHEIAYNDKKRFMDEEGGPYDDLTFKNACEGTRKQNIQFRHTILTEIISKVKKVHPDIPSLEAVFNLS